MKIFANQQEMDECLARVKAWNEEWDRRQAIKAEPRPKFKASLRPMACNNPKPSLLRSIWLSAIGSKKVLVYALALACLLFSGCKSHTQGIDPKLVPESGYGEAPGLTEPVSLQGDVHQALREVETGERFREWRGK